MPKPKHLVPLLLTVLVSSLVTRAPHCLGSAVANNDYTRVSLSGLDGIYVVVQPISPQIEALGGLTAADVKTDTERLLRTAGVNVLAKEEWIKTKGGPVCFVAVDVVRERIITGEAAQGLYAFDIRVEFNQDVFLVRNPAVRVLSPTWSTSYLGLTNSLPRIREKTKMMVERFIDAFQAVNNR
jgi:hypothetical protein